MTWPGREGATAEKSKVIGTARGICVVDSPALMGEMLKKVLGEA